MLKPVINAWVHFVYKLRNTAGQYSGWLYTTGSLNGTNVTKSGYNHNFPTQSFTQFVQPFPLSFSVKSPLLNNRFYPLSTEPITAITTYI